jgi:hypothetical protein
MPDSYVTQLEKLHPADAAEYPFTAVASTHSKPVEFLVHVPLRYYVARVAGEFAI